MTIEIRPWSAGWVAAYERAAADLRAKLGQSVMIKHVGSTAVEGLPAKPIVDLLIGLSDKQRLDQARELLSGNNWVESKPSGSVAAFLNCPPSDGMPGLNAHLTVIGDAAWTDLLMFRDWMRMYPERAQTYTKLKNELAAACGDDIELYTRGKSRFVSEVLTNARSVNATLMYQRYALGRAVALRCISIMMQLSVAAAAMLSVLCSSQDALVVVAGITLLLVLAWLASDRVCRKQLSEGEQARRLIQVEYGLGHPVAERSLIAEAFRSPPASLSAANICVNFATRAPPGMRRLAEMIDESAFFGAAVQGASAAVTAGFLIVVSVATFLGFLLLGPRLESSLLTTAIRMFMAFAVFLLSADVIGAAIAHGQASAEMRKIRLRISAARGRNFPEGDVIQAMVDYNAVVDGAPPPLPFIFEVIEADISRKWNAHKAHVEIGHQVVDTLSG